MTSYEPCVSILTLGLERRGKLSALDFSGDGWLLLPGGVLVADDLLTSLALQASSKGPLLTVIRPATYGIELLRRHRDRISGCVREFPPSSVLCSFAVDPCSLDIWRALLEDRRIRIRRQVNETLSPNLRLDDSTAA